MDNLFVLRNENGEIAINDTYKNFTLLGKFSVPVVGVTYSTEVFTGSIDVDLTNNPFEIDSRDLESYHNKTLCLVKTDGTLFRDAYINFEIVGDTAKKMTIFARSNTKVAVEVVVYTYARRTESQLGLVVYNQDGDVVFDVLRGFLQAICVVNEKIDLYQDDIDFKLPDFLKNINISNIYVGKLNKLPELELYAGTRQNYYVSYFPQVIELNSEKYLRAKAYGRGGTWTKIIQKYHDVFSIIVAYVP